MNIITIECNQKACDLRVRVRVRELHDPFLAHSYMMLISTTGYD